MADKNDHALTWWITKRTPTFTISANSVNLQDADGKRNSTVVVTHQGNGKVIAISRDLSVASVSVTSNTNLNIARQGKGNTNIFVMLGSDTTYKIPPAQYINVNCGENVIPVTKPQAVSTQFTYSGNSIAYTNPLNTAAYSVNTVNSAGQNIANPVNADSYTTTFVLKSGYIWSDINNRDDYKVTWKIIKSQSNLNLSRVNDTSTYRYDEATQFQITRNGNGNISLNAETDGTKPVITSADNDKYNVKWQCTGTVKLTATVAESANYTSGTVSINCVIHGKLPNLSINDLIVTALNSTKASFSCLSNGKITVNQPSAVSSYVSIESDTSRRFTFTGKKMNDSISVTATVAADGLYDSGTCSFKVCVNGASRQLSYPDNVTATTLNEAFIFTPATSDKGSIRFKDLTSENPNFVYDGWMYDQDDGSIQIWTDKAGKAKITFTAYDPDGVYSDIKHFCYVTVVKRDRNVSFNIPSDIQMYHSESITVNYDGDGDIKIGNTSMLSVSVNGKKNTCTPSENASYDRVGKFSFSIAQNDYYSAYTSGDLQMSISICSDYTHKIYYTYKTDKPSSDNDTDLIGPLTYGLTSMEKISIAVSDSSPNRSVNVWIFVYVGNELKAVIAPALTLVDGTSHGMSISNNAITLHSSAMGGATTRAYISLTTSTMFTNCTPITEDRILVSGTNESHL